MNIKNRATSSWEEMERWSKGFDQAVRASSPNTKSVEIDDWVNSLNTALKSETQSMSSDHFEELLNYALYDKGIDKDHQEQVFKKVEVRMKEKVWIANIDYSTTRISKNDPRLSEQAMLSDIHTNESVLGEGPRSFFDYTRNSDTVKEFHNGKLDTPKQYAERNGFSVPETLVAKTVAEKAMKEAHAYEKEQAKPEQVILLQKKHKVEIAYLDYRTNASLNGRNSEAEKKAMLDLYKDYKATALNKEFRLSFKNNDKKFEMKEVEIEIKPEFTQVNKRTGKQLDVFKNDYIIETDLRTKEQKIVQEPADIVEQRRQGELKEKFERAEAKRLETEKMVNRIQANLTMRKGSQRKR